mgnify:FL=1
MDFQCPEFAEVSDILFDVKEKLSDQEYNDMYKLLGKIKAFKCPEEEADPCFAGQTTVTMTSDVLFEDMRRTTAWRHYAKGLEASVLCLLATMLFVAYTTNDTPMFILGLVGFLVIVPQLQN